MLKKNTRLENPFPLSVSYRRTTVAQSRVCSALLYKMLQHTRAEVESAEPAEKEISVSLKH